MIRVLLVDDHRLVRASLRSVLDGADGVEVAGEAASGEDAIGQARDAAPDVVLMDVNMPGIGGLEATRRLRMAAPGARVIALTAHRDDPYPAQMLDAGAAGYLTKDCAPDELVDAIRRASRSPARRRATAPSIQVSPAATRRIASTSSSGAQSFVK